MDSAKLFLSSFGGGGGGGNDPGDPIGNSLRFRMDAQQYMSRTAVTPTDATKFTLSFWVKRGRIGGQGVSQTCIMYSGLDKDNKNDKIEFPTNNSIEVKQRRSSVDYTTQTTAVFRDPSAWYHIVYTWENGSKTIYVNGIQQTCAPDSSTTDTHYWQTAGLTTDIGRDTNMGGNPTNYFTGFLAEYYFVDGQILEPTSFGRVNDNGVWVPVKPEGLTFGSNGFYLDFSDPNDIGADRSPNGNNFTPHNFNTNLVYGGDYADPTITSYDTGTMTVPTVNGGAPYIIDIQDDLNSGTWCTYNPSGWSNGVTDGPGNTNGTYIGEPYAQFFSFDLRDFPTVTNLAVWSGWNQPAGGGNAHAQLLDENKNVIAGTRVNLQRHNDFSVRYELCNTDVGARYIQFDCSQSDSTVFIYGIEVNGGLLVQGGQVDVDYDPMFDSPTQNTVVLNNFNTTGGDNGIAATNLQNQDTNSAVAAAYSGTFSMTGGRHYYEITRFAADNDGSFGIVPDSLHLTDGNVGTLEGAVIYMQGYLYVLGIQTNPYLPAIDQGDTVCVAFDADNGDIWFGRNGTFIGDPVAGTNPAATLDMTTGWTPYVRVVGNTGLERAAINCGQQPFRYTPPAGFNAVQTTNLPEASILNGRDHFQAITGPGTGQGDPSRQGNWIQDLFTAPPGTREAAMTSTAIAFQGGSQNAARAFDNNTGTLAETGPTSVSGSPCWITFRPRDTTLPALVCNSQFRIRLRRCQQLWVNGIQMTGNFTGEDAIYDLSSQLTFPFTLESVAMQAINGNDVGLYGFDMDGAYLVQSGILQLAQQTFPNGLWWIKDRANTNQHQLVDSVRGVNIALQCPSTDPETAYVAPAGESVAWCWNSGGPAVANNDGSLPSQVSANIEAGFSIATYTGTNTNGSTVGHGLSKAPEFCIIKCRSNNVTNWIVYHPAVPDPDLPTNNYLQLNSVSAISSAGGPRWMGIDDSVVTLGSYQDTASNEDYVLYSWHSVPGYSAFGSYQGNGAGSPNSPFVYLGFQPAFLLIKCLDYSAGDITHWFLHDTTREYSNPHSNPLASDTTAVEYGFSSSLIDLVSNGFKLRGGPDQQNGNHTYVYAAFAENPFQSPVTAR